MHLHPERPPASLSRRHFLTRAGASLAAVALLPEAALAKLPCDASYPAQPLSFAALSGGGARMRDQDTAFAAWLSSTCLATEPPIKDLVYNFYNLQKKQARWPYPMLSAKAILWALQRGYTTLASRLARGLIRWQQVDKAGPLARSFGAFPSRINRRGEQWVRGGRYYSGDNLVIVEALLALFDKTKDKALLNSATGVGTWLTSVMSQGHKYGVWAEDHGAPMHFVDDKGNFSNHIHGNVEMLWIGALKRLGAATGERAYCEQANKAMAFYRKSQRANGAFWDHYNPGYPPARYNAKGWKAYQPGQVIADNQIRSALGLCRMGDLDAARRFYRWLKIDAKGGVPAYLNLETGGPGFPEPSQTYFDVVSSGLHRSLAQWMGDRAAAQVDMDFIGKVRGANGGWYWGIRRSDLNPVTNDQAPITGLWAVADLSVRIG